MAPSNKTCSFVNCTSSSGSSDVRFFAFPRSNPEKCSKWVVACGNPDLENICDIDLTANYYVCSKHFSLKDYVYKHGPLHGTSNLIPSAIPKQEQISSDSVSNPLQPVKKRKHRKPYPQKYRKTWEKDESFQLWLTPDPNDATKAWCKFCNLDLTAELHVLTHHKESAKHQLHELIYQDNLKTNGDMPVPLKPSGTEIPAEDLHNAEVLLSSLIVSHNLPDDIAEPLGTLVKECFPDSVIAQSLDMKKDKFLDIVQNVIGASRKGYLAAKLRKTKFSVMIDSVDDSMRKRICIVVTYNHYKEMLFLTELWDIIDLEINQDSNIICDAILSSFEEASVSFKQIIGFAFDGFDTTMATVARGIEQVLPEVMIFNRMFHCLPKVVSKACLELPTACEDLVRNVHEYLNGSARKENTLAHFPAFLEQSPDSHICWISQLYVVRRMLAQWEQLQLYFSNQCITERPDGVQIIYHALHDGFVLAFFKFLKWVLPKFILLEQQLIDRKAFLPTVHEHMTTTFKYLLGCYMSRDYIMEEDLSNVNPRDSKHFLPLDQMYLGVAVQQEIQNVYISDFPEDLETFLHSCQSFLVTACDLLRQVYDYGSPFLDSLSVLIPKRTVLGKGETEKLVLILQHLPKMDNDDKFYDSVEGEWKGLQCAEIPPEIACIEQPDIFWNCIYHWKNESRMNVFPAVGRLALRALLAPYANRDCESIFQLFQEMHNRNQSQNLVDSDDIRKTIAARGLKSTGCCISLKVTRKMRKLMASLQNDPSSTSIG